MNKFRSLYNYACGINFAYLLVLGLVIKALVSDVSYATFLLTIPVLGFESYKMYLKSKAPDAVAINQEVMSELDKLKAKVNANTFEKGLSQTPGNKRYF